jgi:hypothetical protein
MGCHTWCYKKINATTREELAPKIKNSIAAELGYIAEMLADKTNPTHAPESLCKIKELLETQLYKLEENELTDEEFYDLYEECVTDDVVRWIPGRGLFISTDELPHDIFRNGEYSEDCLFSLEETRQWMREHVCEVYEWTDAELAAFWKNYPDGMIAFG